jgi:hypothetical protein
MHVRRRKEVPAMEKQRFEFEMDEKESGHSRSGSYFWRYNMWIDRVEEKIERELN